MQLDGPGFIPKAALTTGRVLHQPFEVPTEMTKSALLQGGVTHALVGEANKAAAAAVEQLQPRGPAKLLSKLFGKVDGSLTQSAAQAQKATEVFWVPFSNGAHQIGDAVANPFSMYYAKRAGFEMPADPAELQKLLTVDILHAGDTETTKFPGFTFPVPAAGGEQPGGGEPPADKPADPPPADTPADPPAEKPADPPAETPTDPPAEKPADPPADPDGGGTSGDGGDAGGGETGGDAGGGDPGAGSGEGDPGAAATETPAETRSIAPDTATVDPAIAAAAEAVTGGPVDTSDPQAAAIAAVTGTQVQPVA